MTKIWCALWNTLLNAFTDVVNTVSYALKTAGTVIADVLTSVGEAVSGVISSTGLGSTLVIGGAVALLVLLSRNKDRDKRT